MNRFGGFSLTGLTPGTTYYFRIDALAIPDPVAIVADRRRCELRAAEDHAKAMDEAPKTYHVATMAATTTAGLCRTGRCGQFKRLPIGSTSGTP